MKGNGDVKGNGVRVGATCMVSGSQGGMCVLTMCLCHGCRKRIHCYVKEEHARRNFIHSQICATQAARIMVQHS